MTGVRITHIGGPTTLIEVGGWRILTDPTFDLPGGRYFFGWGTTSRKLTGPAISVDDLGDIDAALVSHHHHGDNLDRSGRAQLPRWGKVITTRAGAAKLGGAATGLSAWDTTTLEAPGMPTITITATPCRHGPAGSEPITGPVVGFALTWDGQENGALWVTGDTVLYRGLRQVASRVKVGTVIMHLGSVRFRYLSGWLRYTMDAKEAVELLGLLSPTTAIPVHYEGWTHFQQGRERATRVFERSPHARAVRWLEPGIPATLTI